MSYLPTRLIGCLGTTRIRCKKLKSPAHRAIKPPDKFRFFSALPKGHDLSVDRPQKVCTKTRPHFVQTGYLGTQNMSAIDSDSKGKTGPCSNESPDSNSFDLARLGRDKQDISETDKAEITSTPGRTRTCDLRIRNPLLYPTELRALLS